MVEYELSQVIQAANAPETIALRDGNDEVPMGVAAYRIVRAVITDQSAAQNDVTLQDYDPEDANADNEVVFSVGAEGTETPGTDTDSPVLTIPRGNQIRVDVEGDADVALYVEPDTL